LTDAFGRAVHGSAVEFTSASAFDSATGITASPSSLLLSHGYGQRAQLSVTGQFTLGGNVSLTGAGQGVTYSSADASVALVGSDGVVVARSNGETDVTVSYLSFSQTVHVIVDSSAQLSSLAILPLAPSIGSVGGSLQLSLQGTLSDGRQVDLTPSSLGTV